MAVWGSDGYLLFLGRKGQEGERGGEVKVRGQRVNLGGVGGVVGGVVGEMVGESEKGVVCEGFVVKQPQTGSLVLCCVVVLGEGGRNLTSREVVERCKRVLPSHFVPSVVLFVSSLPLTPNGKLNKKGLEEMALEAFCSFPPCSSSSSSSSPSYCSPSSPSPSPFALPSFKRLKNVVTNAWSQVLGESNNNTFKDDDNFFSVGGDSLLAIFIVSQMKSLAEQAEEKEEQKKREIEEGEGVEGESLNEDEREAIFSFLVYDFLECLTIQKTVELLVERIKESQKIESNETATTPTPTTSTLIPVTGAGRMYLELLCPHTNHYNQGVSFLIPNGWRRGRGHSEGGLVEEAVRELVRAHPMLGCKLVGGDSGEWFFSMKNEEGREDGRVRVMEGWEGEEEELVRIGGEIHSSLDPFSGRMFAVGYFLRREGEEEGDAVVLVGHHLVVDAFSWEIICQDFTEICVDLEKRGGNGGRRKRVNGERDGYERWVVENSGGKVGRGGDMLKRAVCVQNNANILVPFLKERNEEKLSEGKKQRYCSVEHSVPLSSSVPSLREVEGLFALSTASSLLSFGNVGGGEEFVMWLEGNGRTVPSLDLSRSVGWFTSVFPLIFEKEEGGDIAKKIQEGKEVLALETWKWLEDNNNNNGKSLKKFSILLNFLASGGKGRGTEMKEGKERGIERMEGVHGSPFHPEGNHFFDLYVGMSLLSSSSSPSLSLHLIFDNHLFQTKKMEKFSLYLLQTFSQSLSPALPSPLPLSNQQHLLTATQQAMFLFSTSSSPSPSPLYISHALFALHGQKVTVIKIQKMFNFLWRRHEALRLFPSEHGKYGSLFSPTTPPSVCSLYLQREKGEGMDKLLERVLEGGLGEELGEYEGERMYFGMGLVEVGEGEEREENQYLFVRYHHALLDGWSLSLLLSEMLSFLNSSSSLAPPPSFLSYLSWHSSLSQHENNLFWKKEFQPPLPSTILSDCLVPSPSPSPFTNSFSCSLPTSVLKNVQHISRKAGEFFIIFYLSILLLIFFRYLYCQFPSSSLGLRIRFFFFFESFFDQLIY